MSVIQRPIGQMSVAKCLLAKCLLVKCMLAKCLFGKCMLAKCPFAKCLLAKCLLAKCLLAKCLLAKCLLAKCLLYWINNFLQNVFCQMSVHECLSAKYKWSRIWPAIVCRSMAVSKMSIGQMPFYQKSCNALNIKGGL
jgi:hypothetical protein